MVEIDYMRKTKADVSVEKPQGVKTHSQTRVKVEARPNGELQLSKRE
jgi:hypothetical protein